MAAVREGRIRLRTALVLAAVAVLGVVALSVAALRGGGPLGASLRLLALGADGVFGSDVELAASPDSSASGFPLVLGVVNTGRRAGRASALRLAVPSWVRVTVGDRLLAGERTEGNPLAFVRLPLAGETIEAGALPVVPAGLERLRLASVVSSMDCRLEWNGVPVFQAAPPWDPARLSRIAIYWALEESGRPEAGLLEVRLPGAALVREPVAVQLGEPVVYPGAAPWPELDSLEVDSFHAVTCGEPERPLALFVMAWHARAGGRMIMVLHARRVRTVLFDLDGDGLVELELQDTNDDGSLETRRPVSYPIPDFLIRPS